MRHWIVTAIAPRVAACEPAQCKVAAGTGAMLLQSLDRVGRAARFEAAGRTQHRAKQQLVAAHHANEHPAHHGAALRAG